MAVDIQVAVVDLPSRCSNIIPKFFLLLIIILW